MRFTAFVRRAHKQTFGYMSRRRMVLSVACMQTPTAFGGSTSKSATCDYGFSSAVT